MKIVKVTYTVQAGYAAQNKQNIRQVMHDLKQAGHDGIRYSAYCQEDGCTFAHLAHFNSADDNRKLSELPAFQAFQKQLKAGQPVAPPKAETLELTGSSFNIF